MIRDTEFTSLVNSAIFIIKIYFFFHGFSKTFDSTVSLEIFTLFPSIL